MHGLWLVSYLALWLLVLTLSLVIVGALGQLGQVRSQGGVDDAGLPPEAEDGPPLGSRLPALEAQDANGTGPVTIGAQGVGRRILLVFFSPFCQSCQEIVEPLNAMAADLGAGVRAIVVMRANATACRAFLNVFPLHVPVICDADRSITMGFRVHRNPFGALYDSGGSLERKGVVETGEHLVALVDGTRVRHDFTPLMSS